MAEEFSYDNVLAYIEGTFWLEGEPIYRITLAKQHGARWVFVYEVNLSEYRTHKVVRKAWKRVLVNPEYTSESIIGKWWNSNNKDRIYKNVEMPHIYQSPVISGVSTLLGTEGDGFYERVKSRNSDEYRPSGVFISLDEVTWDYSDYKYNADDVAKEAKRASIAQQIADSSGEDGSGVYY